jgi:hypothetical protein
MAESLSKTESISFDNPAHIKTPGMNSSFRAASVFAAGVDVVASIASGTPNFLGTANQLAETALQQKSKGLVGRFLGSGIGKTITRGLEILGSPACKRIIRLTLATTALVAASASTGGAVAAVGLGVTIGAVAYNSYKEYSDMTSLKKRGTIMKKTGILKAHSEVSKQYLKEVKLDKELSDKLQSFCFSKNTLKTAGPHRELLSARIVKAIFPKAYAEKLARNKPLMKLPYTIFRNITECASAIISSDFVSLSLTLTVGLASENKTRTEFHNLNNKIRSTIRSDLDSVGLKDKKFRSIENIDNAVDKLKFMNEKFADIIHMGLSKEENTKLFKKAIISAEKEFQKEKDFEKAEYDKKPTLDKLIQSTVAITKSGVPRKIYNYLKCWNPFYKNDHQEYEKKLQANRDSLNGAIYGFKLAFIESRTPESKTTSTRRLLTSLRIPLSRSISSSTGTISPSSSPITTNPLLQSKTSVSR